MNPPQVYVKFKNKIKLKKNTLYTRQDFYSLQVKIVAKVLTIALWEKSINMGKK